MESRLPVLHLITDGAILARPTFEADAAAALVAGGPKVALHLRARHLNGNVGTRLTRGLVRVAEQSGAMVIVNGRADVALAGGAHGVQLGRGALSVAELRTVTPTLLLGLSLHDHDDVTAALGADWIIAGHVFGTATHPTLAPLGVSLITRMASASQVPVIAIGGITPARVAAVFAAGAAGVAVLSGIWNENEPKAAVIRYLTSYDDWSLGGPDRPHGQREDA